MSTSKKLNTYAFIDASNLFYGGEKSLGWKIDYNKLAKYLSTKYGVSKIFYFGGVEINNFKYDYLKHTTVPLEKLRKYLEKAVLKNDDRLNKDSPSLTINHLQRVKFYQKLEQFGYELWLKPVKTYPQEDGVTKRKANCDVDMAFVMMREIESYTKVIFLSGDGDFLPLLKHLKSCHKEVIVLARGPRTAREIRQIAGSNFRDFVRIKHEIGFKEKRH